VSTTEREESERERGRSWRRKDREDTARLIAQLRGGEVEDIIDDLEEAGKEFSDSHLTSEGFKEKEVYPYGLPDGSRPPLYEVVRYEHEKVAGAKRFIQRRWVPPGKIVFGAGSLKVLYRWPDLAARPDDKVFFTEGEKDADRIASIGLLGTTVASQKWSPEAAEPLRGRDVVVLEDNDEKGRENALRAAEVLADVAKSVRVVRLPGLKRKQDVSDWLDAGHTNEELHDVVEATRPEGIHRINISAWKDKPVPKQEWAVMNRFPLNCVTLLSGEGGGGKSLLQLMLSTAAVLGRRWLDETVRPGPALFIDAEDGEDVLHRRLVNVLAHYEASLDDVEQALHLESLLNQDAVLGAPSRSGKIEATPRFHKLLEMAGDLKPSIIGIASSANVFAGNENDRSQVQQFVAMLTRLATTANGGLVLISHSSLTGIANKSGLSGSTQWHNAVRARAYVSGVRRENSKEDEMNSDLRVIEFKKNNYGPLSESITLRYVKEKGLFLPVAGMTVDSAELAQAAEDAYLAVLKKLIGQNQRLSANRGAKNYAPNVIALQPEAKSSKEVMAQAQQRLLDADKIHIGPLPDAAPSKQGVTYVWLGPATERPM
jgi:RecA-family ATPase